MSEYDDRNVWSDENLLYEYGKKQRVLGAVTYKSAWGECCDNIKKYIADISAALLARMQPAEAGRWHILSNDDIISINDVVYYRKHAPVVVTKDFEYIGKPRTNYCWDINFGCVDIILRPVSALEPPATEEEEWEELPIFEGLLQEGDRIHHRNGFVIPIMGENIGESVFGCLANPYVTKITRRVRKQKPIPNTSNDFPQPAFCSTCGTAIGIEGEDEPDRDTAPNSLSTSRWRL